MLVGRELSFMRSSNIFAGFFVSVAFLLSGCDDIKDKLGMADKKESASKEDSKDKKDKKKAADDEEEDEKPKAGSSASAAAPASPAQPTARRPTPAGPTPLSEPDRFYDGLSS